MRLDFVSDQSEADFVFVRDGSRYRVLKNRTGPYGQTVSFEERCRMIRKAANALGAVRTVRVMQWRLKELSSASNIEDFELHEDDDDDI